MKRWKITLCGALVVLLLVTSMVGRVHAASYPDISGHWAEESINRWTDYGVVNGYSDGSFHPDDYITRGQMATILTRRFGWTERSANIFADLDENQWYADAVLKATAAGIMEGDGEKVFPDDYITREDAITMIARALKLEGKETELTYGDQADIDVWARSAVAAMTEQGYIIGAPDGNLYPLSYITRAETVVILDRAIAAPGTTDPTDPEVTDRVEVSAQPSAMPSAGPGVAPSAEPSVAPSAEPSVEPSEQPSVEPSAEPSVEPSEQPSATPSAEPNPEATPSGKIPVVSVHPKN